MDDDEIMRLAAMWEQMDPRVKNAHYRHMMESVARMPNPPYIFRGLRPFSNDPAYQRFRGKLIP